MDKLIPKYYKIYGEHSNYFRMIPLGIDGLKPVERRTLLSVYDLAKEKFVKCAQVDGHTIGRYHPHASIYGSLVQLVNRGFIDGQGNFGTKIGVQPCNAAASRYTECKLNKHFLKLAFELIEFVPWVDAEIPGRKEPKYLPVKYPICFLGNEYTQGIGFGYKTSIPCFDEKDLQKRLFWLLGKRKTKPTIKPVSKCNIISKDKELEELLTTGKGKISIKGIYKIDKINYKVILKSWHPDNKFETFFLKKFDNELKDGDINYDDLSAGTETSIHFKVIKQKNKTFIFEKLIKKMDRILHGVLNFNCIIIDENISVKEMSIDNMLLKTYEMYKNTMKKKLEKEIFDLNEAINELNLLEKIKPYISKYLKSIEKINIDEIAKKISIDVNCNEKEVTELFNKYKIRKLFTLNTDISGFVDKLKISNSNLNDLENFVLKQYTE